MHVWQGELDQAASQRALGEVLGLYLDEEPASVELRVGKYGKPALADPLAPLRFNLSHSGGLILIALCWRGEVGVDVERIRPRSNLLRLAESALDPAAAATVRAAPFEKRVRAFHEAWVRHEAIAKCHGTGLRRKPAGGGPVTVAMLDDVAVGYAAAIAIAGEAMPTVKRFELAARPLRQSSPVDHARPLARRAENKEEEQRHESDDHRYGDDQWERPAVPPAPAAGALSATERHE